MDKKRNILEREELRQRPYSVPDGYFDALQTRLSVIPQREVASRTWMRPVFAFATGIAAVLVACVILFHPSGESPDAMTDIVSYEQMAYADLIPRTDPYIYYGDETEQPADPTEEEMMDYLLQNQNILTLNDLQK